MVGIKDYIAEGEEDIPEGVKVYISERETGHILEDITPYDGPLSINLKEHDGSTGKETEITLINKIEGNDKSTYEEYINQILAIISAHKADTPTGTSLLGKVKLYT